MHTYERINIKSLQIFLSRIRYKFRCSKMYHNIVPARVGSGSNGGNSITAVVTVHGVGKKTKVTVSPV